METLLHDVYSSSPGKSSPHLQRTASNIRQDWCHILELNQGKHTPTERLHKQPDDIPANASKNDPKCHQV